MIKRTVQKLRWLASRVVIRTHGWPWQLVGNHWSSSELPGARWGWNPFKLKSAGRFGGWWLFKFGIVCGSREMILELILGSIRIRIKSATEE